MKNKQLILFFALAIVMNVSAQDSLDTLLRVVSEKNQRLQSAANLYEAEAIASRVGNSPPNPEIEYGYMWGTPEALGERVDFSISQSFDFPTAYTSQSKLSKISEQQSDLKLQATRQEVLLMAQKTWIQAVFFNLQEQLLEDRLEQSRQVYEGFKQKFETGEANIIQLNQALLKTTLLENDLERTRVAIQNNGKVLDQITVGELSSIRDTILPEPGNLLLDSLQADYDQAPVNAWYQKEVAKREQAKDVIFNRKLPRLMAGYYSEKILNTKLRGIKAGITIPLWGNAKAVNSAKASQAFAASDAWRFQSEQKADVAVKYGQWKNLKEQAEELGQLINSSNNEDLLLQSVDAGEISLTQYFYESDFFFQSRLALLETKRDLLLLEAELLKIYK